ncbi:DUF1501 domain-containing protein [Paraferrimonas sp. SM1919]|uniref:DUF1501 domain-containing protein n=1 Tax=Paraferrimonas sp. SM1919 TaxID=2662263 RepID=UPI0013D5D7F0|nr:DUF1501 domain-containing protein [Paraferrimonas sp. SM1919]
MDRRQFLTLGGATLLTLQCPWAFAEAKRPAKFIWINLRGALDHLHTLVPTFEHKLLQQYRPDLYGAIAHKLLGLDPNFALHPELPNLHQWFKQKQMLAITATSSAYRGRSHFDGQDFLESGKSEIDHDSGWLGRALQQRQALVVSMNNPIVARGSHNSQTWYPSNLNNADINYQSIIDLYSHHQELSTALTKGVALSRQPQSKQSSSKQGKFIHLAKACAQLMTSENIDAAVLELGGWDTHNQQANRLNVRLAELDQGLAVLKQHLGSQWQNTVIAVSTEFGRTVRQNGTGGTDHGSASMMFIAGGSVNGGQVLGQWPGLAQQQLFQNRDLNATSNVHDWLATLLAQHWQLNSDHIKSAFPSAQLLRQKMVIA